MPRRIFLMIELVHVRERLALPRPWIVHIITGSDSQRLPDCLGGICFSVVSCGFACSVAPSEEELGDESAEWVPPGRGILV